jgi:uncharacterized LabA/DUF88 family protein
MPHPEIERLVSAPEARVMVFVDGQNLYKRCDELFGHPLCHVHLLAEHLAGPRVLRRVACRFYTGRPNPNLAGEEKKVRNLDRRLGAMRGAGVTVITRELRYHWTWGPSVTLPAAREGSAPVTVELRPWRRPQEKGVDLALGLDVVEFALSGLFDVGIVVSLDRDLAEIPRAIRNLGSHLAKPVRLEAAVPVGGSRRAPVVLSGFHFTHQITQAVFERVRDDTDYTVSPEAWERPTIPTNLADLP